MSGFLERSYRRFRRAVVVRPGARGEPATRIALILCTQRSGSTWLFDALRCHPAIEVQPDAAAFAALADGGRRYPRDLTSTAPDATRIEVAPGQWEGIPRFELRGAGIDRAACQALPVWSIEKLHPHFFFNDQDALLRRLARLERRSLVRLILLAREPEAALASFLRYQRRDPTWYPHVTPEAAADLLRRDLETLLAIARRREALVLDYQDLARAFQPTLRRVFAHLWPDEGGAVDSAAYLAGRIDRATARERRLEGAGAFLSDASRPAGPELDELLTRQCRAVLACRDLYAELREPAAIPRATV